MFEGFTRTEIDDLGGRAHPPAPRRRRPAAVAAARQPADPCVVAQDRAAPRRAFPCRLPPICAAMATASAPTMPGPNSINYSFRAMAQDQVEVMEQLGYREFFVAGHDRGARTTARMCLDHPDRVKKRRARRHPAEPSHLDAHLARMGDAVVALGDDGAALRFSRAHAGRHPGAVWFMEQKLSKPGIGLGFFDPEAFAEYVRCFNWKTIKGSCADYRACATCDFEMDKRRFRGRPQDHRAAPGDLGRPQPHRGRPRRRARDLAAQLRDRRLGRRAPLRPLRARGSAGRDLPSTSCGISGIDDRYFVGAPTSPSPFPLRRSPIRSWVRGKPDAARGVLNYPAGANGGRPRIISAAFSAIMMTGALMLPPTRSGITEASTTRRPSTP